jgi:glutathione S-transferase
MRKITKKKGFRMMQLYQFAISHFCEKARWALDYKKADYELVNLLPGFHGKTIRRIAPRTSVPVLRNGDKIIQGSADIISYLDEQIEEFPLTPATPSDRSAALEWEKYLDKELGVNIRLICYHYLLQQKKLLVPMLCYGTAWYNSLLINVGFGKFEKLMRKYMKINAESVEVAKAQVDEAVARINSHLADQQFLVGQNFSRADLTAAALMAPLAQPPEYQGPLPAYIPAELAEYQQTLMAKTQWVLDNYREFRS